MPQLENIKQAPQEWLQSTLSIIGDAIITTDTKGAVTFLNPTAESLTGWTLKTAIGEPLERVFRIVHRKTRRALESLAARVLREGVVVEPGNDSLLVVRDGSARPIDNSAAPIRDADGRITGVALVFRDATERRQKSLESALAYADGIIATLREPFAVLDRSRRVVTANRAFYQSFKLTPAKTRGRAIDELWDIPGLRELMEDVMRRGQPLENSQLTHDFPGIGQKMMQLNARRINEPGHETDLILLALEDITDRTAADQTRAELAAVVESSDDAIISKTLDGTITSWNAGAQRLFGYTAAEVVGRSIATLVPPERSQEMPQILSRLRNGERVDHYETVRRRKDGTMLDISLSVSPIRDSSGRIIGASKIARDITGRKKAEVALRDSELRYRRLFETAPDAILIFDPKSGRIVDANPSIQQLLGCTETELLGKEMWELGASADKEAIRGVFQELNEKGFSRSDHLPLQSRSGQAVDVEFVGRVYQVDHHSVIQCNIRDISDRSRLERQAQEQTDALADLHRRKDEFLAMLSHELRNPLAPISNAVQLLRMRKDKDEDQLQQRARDIIGRQVTQLTRLVDDLLEVSRITTGRIQIRPARVSMSGIVEHAVETVRPLIDERRHELTVSLPPEPIFLHADAARLEQVVANLLTNAARYTDEGGRIGLSVQQEGDEAILRVRDSGVGIAPELLPRVFDLFTQSERKFDRAHGGLGVGLALVQRLVEMHRGKVEVSSALGQGSEFVVRLPVAPRPVEKLPSTPAGETAPARSPLRVLVVDDNVDAAQSMEMLLKMSGHQVHTTHDGPAALEACLDHRPDVLLLDIGLPGMDGYEVAQRIRGQAALKDVMLVAMTGYGRELDRERSRDAGFDHHLVKPADFGTLQQILATVPEPVR